MRNNTKALSQKLKREHKHTIKIIRSKVRKEIKNQLTNVSPLSHNPSSKSNHKLYKSPASTLHLHIERKFCIIILNLINQNMFHVMYIKLTNKNKNLERTT